jgi:hypothetical protein
MHATTATAHLARASSYFLNAVLYAYSSDAPLVVQDLRTELYIWGKQNLRIA